MFLELIATFTAALGAAGLVLLLNKLTGSRLPKWVMPVAAGLTMIAYTIWSEYSWAERTAAELPPGMVVVKRIEQRAIWKPWTYIQPQVKALVVLDHAGMKTRPQHPQIKLADLYVFARWRRTSVVPQLLDCARDMRADVSDAALADPTQADWRPITGDDKVLDAACAPLPPDQGQNQGQDRDDAPQPDMADGT